MSDRPNQRPATREWFALFAASPAWRFAAYSATFVFVLLTLCVWQLNDVNTQLQGIFALLRDVRMEARSLAAQAASVTLPRSSAGASGEEEGAK